MLEVKLIVGRYLNLPNNVVMPAIANLEPVGSFQVVALTTVHIEQSTGVFTKTSQVSPGLSQKARRNFRFLPWVSGRISEADLSTDVLTGPMSGCWLVKYKKNGVTHCGHLGTDVASDEKTTAVNTTWNTWATDNADDVIGGFNPLRWWNANQAIPVANKAEHPQPRFFGLFTTTGQYYTMVTFQVNANPSLLRIAGIQLTPSSSKQKLQQVDQPGI